MCDRISYFVIAVTNNVAGSFLLQYVDDFNVVKCKPTHYVILRPRLLNCSMIWTEGKGHGISRRSMHRLDNMPPLIERAVIDLSVAKVSYKVPVLLE